MMWSNILFLIQSLFSTVFLQKQMVIRPGSGYLLDIDEQMRTLMELSYRRCTLMDRSKVDTLLNFNKLVTTGRSLAKLHNYFIDLENIVTELNFKRNVLVCKFIAYHPESLNKDICTANEDDQTFCADCKRSLTCYNRIMETFFANDRINYTVEIYDS